jgi:uncharacterized protein (DUF1800 family)
MIRTLARRFAVFPSRSAPLRFARALAIAAPAILAACSNWGESSMGPEAAAVDSTAPSGPFSGVITTSITSAEIAAVAKLEPKPTRRDAARFLQQSSFGPNETTVGDVAAKGFRAHLLEQFIQPVSRYRYTLSAYSDRARLHTDGKQDFCGQFAPGTLDGAYCEQEWFGTAPVDRDFFLNASKNPDQLRQRVAFALSQIFVTSGREVNGSYGFAEYNQLLLDNAFGNFRTLLEKVTTSPLMGMYLNMVNNDRTEPNENYARELLQLFSIGTCVLNPDGSMAGGKCTATYGNDTVREYAFALTGWTYPKGGVDPWCVGCQSWKNPIFLRGPMVAVPAQHDANSRRLLSGVSLSGSRTPQQALSGVLDSIMAHQNVGPFIGKQMIQFLVTSNPSPAYVGRVSAAFNSGVYTDRFMSIGSGTKGDMRAMLAAILLDAEARDAAIAAQARFGKLREPVQYMLNAVRALNGVTDGEYLGRYAWGDRMGQPVFNAVSVFNFYPADYALTGTDMAAPQFGIENVSTTLSRISYLNDLIFDWYNAGAGLSRNPLLRDAVGTKLDLSALASTLKTAADSGAVVDRLNELLLEGRLSSAEKGEIVNAMNAWTPADTWLMQSAFNSSWQIERVKSAAYLIFASPKFMIQR